MSQKRPNAKHKIDRRLGCNLWGRPKSPYNTRQTGPGQHGTRRGKMSDYGMQLMAKQKLKGYYANIGERKFRRYFAEANRLRGDTGQNLIGLLNHVLMLLFTVRNWFRPCLPPVSLSVTNTSP